MLSYQHGYHAGNLADLHKHIVLVSLWSVLKRKPRALSFVDTHAGRGFYPLGDAFALKTGEQAEGLGKYAGGAVEFDQVIEKARKKFGSEIYPGSGALIAAMAGEDDRLILAELHPNEFKHLKENMGRYAELHKRDGLEMAEALAPFKPRRGLIFIDPSFEVKSEYEALPKSVGRILRKWPQAVVMIWYPILAGEPHKVLISKLETQGELRSEVIFKSTKMRMRGSGVLVLNAPFGTGDVVKNELSACANLFSFGRDR